MLCKFITCLIGYVLLAQVFAGDPDSPGGNPSAQETHGADQTVSVPGNAKRLSRDLNETRDLRRLGLKNVRKDFHQSDPDSVWPSIRGAPDCRAAVEWLPMKDEILQEWHFKTDSNKTRRYRQELAVWASPALAVINGIPMAFIGGADQTLHALDLKNREQVWAKISNAEITNAPAVGETEGGKIVFWASSDRTLYANYAVTGEKFWTKELVPPSSTLGAVQISSPLLFKDRLFISFFAYDKSLSRNSQKAWLMEIGASDGATRWKTEISQGPVNSPNGIETNGKLLIFTVAKKGLLQCFDVTDGKPLKSWQFQMPHEVLGSPCVYKTDSGKTMVFLGSKYGNIIAIDAETGKELWQRMAGNWIDNTVCAGKIGDVDAVIMGSYDYCVYSLNAVDGSLLWKTPVGGEVFSAPCLFNIDGKPAVLVSALNNHMYLLDGSDGKIISSYFTGNPVWDKIAKGETLWGSPAIVEAGTETSAVYGSCSGTVYVLPLAKECSLSATARSSSGLWLSLLAIGFIFICIILPVTVKMK
jgi:outer membrane protein assembly factor BamB